MKILHVIAQKPQDTGSGVYVNNLIKHLQGFEQCLVAGIDIEDSIEFDIPFYPVVFNGEELGFPVVGMSDKMPYESTTYSELRGEKLGSWRDTFTKRLNNVKREFKPDIVISHHLYLLTSIVRDIFSDIPVVGVCHATDLRQLNSHDLEEKYIRDRISRLDRVLALHREQRDILEKEFFIERDKIYVMGLGYDSNIFNTKEEKSRNKEIWYVGKMSKAKGVEELLEAYKDLDTSSVTRLKLAGGIGGEEGKFLEKKAAKIGKDIEVLGQLEQQELARGLQRGRILVLPSYYEGFPMVVIEALACGMEVVVNDLPGLKEGLGKTLLDSGRVHIVPMPKLDGLDRIDSINRDNYIESLKKKLVEVVDSERAKGEISLENFTWEGVAERYIDLLDRLFKKTFQIDKKDVK